MRRATVSVACALVLLCLPSCESTRQTKATQPTAPQPTGNLGERVRPTLTGDWKVEDSENALAAPPVDRWPTA